MTNKAANRQSRKGRIAQRKISSISRTVNLQKSDSSKPLSKNSTKGLVPDLEHFSKIIRFDKAGFPRLSESAMKRLQRQMKMVPSEPLPKTRKRKTKQVKLALVLSGGSAKGFAHIGVLKGLEEIGVTPSLIIGTSMGSLVGAMYAWNPDWTWVYSEARRHKPYDMLTLSDLYTPKQGIIQGDRFEHILKNAIRDAEFKDLKIPLIINTVDVMEVKTYEFRSGKVAKAARASSSVPAVFKPVSHEGKVLVDGGLLSNLYFDPLLGRAEEFDAIILVNLNNEPLKLKRNFTVIDLIVQNMSIVLQSQVEKSFKILEMDKSKEAMAFKERMVVINPSISDLSGLQFDKLDEFVKRGYDAFLKARPKIKTLLKKK